MTAYPTIKNTSSLGNRLKNYWRFFHFSQIVFLVVVLFFERVVGLPILFIGLVVQGLDLANFQRERVLLLVSAVLFGLVYNLSIFISFLLIALSFGSWIFSKSKITSKTVRMLLVVVVFLIPLVVVKEIRITWQIIFYSGISLGVLARITRVNYRLN